MVMEINKGDPHSAANLSSHLVNVLKLYFIMR